MLREDLSWNCGWAIRIKMLSLIPNNQRDHDETSVDEWGDKNANRGP